MAKLPNKERVDQSRTLSKEQIETIQINQQLSKKQLN
jgi:hypothetical protein